MRIFRTGALASLLLCAPAMAFEVESLSPTNGQATQYWPVNAEVGMATPPLLVLPTVRIRVGDGGPLDGLATPAILRLRMNVDQLGVQPGGIGGNILTIAPPMPGPDGALDLLVEPLSGHAFTGADMLELPLLGIEPDPIQVGDAVTLIVEAIDPVTNTPLAPSEQFVLYQAVEGLEVEFRGPMHPGFGPRQRIDVRDDAYLLGFEPDGPQAAGVVKDLYAVGSIAIRDNPLLPPGLVDLAQTPASITLFGKDFSAFQGEGGIRVGARSDCSDFDTATPLTVSGTGDSAGSALVPATAVLGTVCVRANLLDRIVPQVLDAELEVGYYWAGLGGSSDLRAFAEADQFLDLDTGGLREVVASFNPGSNVSVDSLLRINNTSVRDGRFTIRARCQDGTELTPASFDLPAYHSVQYGSRELESGNISVNNDPFPGNDKPPLSNGLGTCMAGRYRLEVSADVGDAEVQTFLRSVTSDGVITTGQTLRD